MVFDYRGYGENPGAPSETKLVADAHSAWKYLTETRKVPAEKIILYGESLGGGVATIREYLRAGLVDEMHLAVAPVVLGAGEALFAGIDLPGLGFAVAEQVATPHALHVVLGKAARSTP